MTFSIDTNILVYFYDGRDAAKQRASQSLVASLARSGRASVGFQVLGELYMALTRKLKMPVEAATEAVTVTSHLFRGFGYSGEDIAAALRAVSTGALGFWDGVLIASSRRAGCLHLISEDMQSGFTWDGLSVVSPFAPSGELTPNFLEMIRP